MKRVGWWMKKPDSNPPKKQQEQRKRRMEIYQRLYAQYLAEQEYFAEEQYRREQIANPPPAPKDAPKKKPSR